MQSTTDMSEEVLDFTNRPFSRVPRGEKNQIVEHNARYIAYADVTEILSTSQIYNEI